MSPLKFDSGARKLVAWSAFLLAGMGAFPSNAHATNLLVNGTFDVSVPNNATGGAWTTAYLGSAGWNSGIGNPAPAFRLNASGFGSDPSIYQTVTGLSVGTVYWIRGEYGLGYGGGPAANSFEIRVDGVDVLQLGPHPDHDPSISTYYPFRSFAVAFMATATSHTILFAAECNGSDHDYFVDNLRLEEDESIPVEALSWGMVKALYRP